MKIILNYIGFFNGMVKITMRQVMALAAWLAYTCLSNHGFSTKTRQVTLI